MLELQGRTLLAAVTTLTSLGFLLIGYDNGVLGGLGACPIPGNRMASKCDDSKWHRL